MIVVHHLENSRSQRVLWLLEELELVYEVRRYERDRDTMMAPPDLRRVHPLGKSPVIEDDGIVIAETGLIVTAFCDAYGDERLAPAKSLGRDSAERLRWLYWLHYAEGSAMPPLLLKLVFGAIPKRAPLLVRPVARAISARVETMLIEPQLKLHFDFWEASLDPTGWFAGEEFSAADIMMSFPVEATARRVGLKPYPRLQAFLTRIHARPAYARALERGGPYSFA